MPQKDQMGCYSRRSPVPHSSDMVDVEVVQVTLQSGAMVDAALPDVGAVGLDPEPPEERAGTVVLDTP